MKPIKINMLIKIMNKLAANQIFKIQLFVNNIICPHTSISTTKHFLSIPMSYENLYVSEQSNKKKRKNKTFKNYLVKNE